MEILVLESNFIYLNTLSIRLLLSFLHVNEREWNQCEVILKSSVLAAQSHYTYL